MSEPIRVLHILGRLDRGGAETMVMNLYRNIDKTKVQFDFIIHTSDKCDYTDEIGELGGKIYSVSRYIGKNHFKYKKELNEFFKNHPEHRIVHGHMRSTATIYLKIAKHHGKVTIAHSHSTASRNNRVEQLVKNIMQLPIRYIADYLFACSDKAGKWLFGKKAIKKANYSVIKNAIDVDKYVFNEKIRKEMKKDLNIEDKFVVGHVGSFTSPKNHRFLLKIFNEVQKKNDDVVLLLIGDGELRTYIEKQTWTLKIQDKVILTGVISNVNEYMQAMDVFVFPSVFEGLGIVAIEAQASGLKCVVADTVPKEAFITDLIKSAPLKAPADIWVNEILKYSDGYERKNTFEEIKTNGYDICDTTNWIEKFYLNELVI